MIKVIFNILCYWKEYEQKLNEITNKIIEQEKQHHKKIQHDQILIKNLCKELESLKKTSESLKMKIRKNKIKLKEKNKEFSTK